MGQETTNAHEGTRIEEGGLNLPELVWLQLVGRWPRELWLCMRFSSLVFIGVHSW